MIVVKTFKSDIAMNEWLSDSENIERLKKEYPPDKYNAELNLIEKQIEVTEKTLHNEKTRRTTSRT